MANGERKPHESLVSRLSRYLLRDYVETGGIEPGGRLPTTRVLAKQYNVSVASVAHALDVLQTQGLVTKRRGSGCYLSEKPVVRPSGTSHSIGLVIPAASAAPLMADLCDGVEQACRERDYHVMISTHNYDFDRERAEVLRAIAGGCEAVILYPIPRLGGEPQESDFLRHGFVGRPLVLVDLGLPELPHAQVVFDNYAVGYDMTKWLIHEGRKAIAFMKTYNEGIEVRHRSNHDRYLGYCDALREHGITPDPAWVWPTEIILAREHDAALEYAQRRVREWKSNQCRVDAVLCVDDPFAVELVTTARAMGVQVPEELQVVGFDNHPIRRVIRPLFPSTTPDFRLAGAKAVDLAVRVMQGVVQPPCTYILPVPLAVSGR